MCEPKLYREFKRKARKSHICSSCGDTISKGETYTVIKGNWDGDFEQYKHCSCCDRMHDLVRKNGVESYYSIETVGEFLVQLQGYDETACDLADLYGLPVDYVNKFIK